MTPHSISRPPSLIQTVLPAFVVGAMLACPVARIDAQPAPRGVLRIGSTGTITGVAESRKEKAGLEALRRFIKEETGLTNQITGQEKWEDLTARLKKGDIDLGVFHGYEFAWAHEKEPGLKPLAIGINVYRYPRACVVVRKDNPAKDFAGLKGQALVLPATNQAFLNLFVDRSCAAADQKTSNFFAKIATAENAEDALDDIVDAKVQVAVLDQTTLEAYQRRKPGRFNHLKEIARSQPFPPIVVAHYGSALDATTLRRFKDCLLNAARKEKGEMLLTLSRLTAFEPVPNDFAQVLAQTRKVYPGKYTAGGRK